MTREIVGSGLCASNGEAIGRIRVINRISELTSIQSGDILVADRVTPDWWPYMSKVGAIITQKGGITSHAAIVARELGIPCIVGVPGATDLENGICVRVIASSRKNTITRVNEVEHFRSQ